MSVVFGSQPEKLHKVTLQLHWKYQFEFAGFIAAKEKGFYKDAGLDVELKEYQYGINIEDEVLSNRVQFGIYNSLSLLEYLRGKPLVLVSSYFKRAALVLAVAPDIKSPKDLVGKEIMATTIEDFTLNFKPYFDAYGVSIDDVKLIPHTYRIDEFVEKKVPAMTAFVSNEICKLNARGIKYNILNPSDDNLFVMQLELITSKQEASQHPDDVEAFRKASQKGWAYALAHKKEIVDIIFNKYNHNVPKKDMLDEAHAVEKLILPYTYEIGSIDRNFLAKQIELFKKNYHVGVEKSLDEFIFHSTQDTQLYLTQQEKAYIENHPKVKVCLHNNIFPIDGYKDGKFVGIAADIYELISKSTGLQFSPIPSSSAKQLRDNISQKKCDLLSLYATNSHRFENLVATKRFLKSNFTFITTLDKPFFNGMQDLRHKVILTQLQPFKEYLLHYFPYLKIEVVSDTNAMIKKLLKGKAYTIVTLDEQADYLINKYGYGKLKINGFFPKDYTFYGGIGVQKDVPLLKSILEKAIAHISKEDINHITNSWKLTRYTKVTDYSLLVKVLIVVALLFAVMLYYQRKLKYFNARLERKMQEIVKKDEILTMQSKQAVMGEMLSMIAHQWRQPLNTITLQISNLQIREMMQEKVDRKELLEVLSEINSTVLYLSETVDDFKTYFRPDKETTQVTLKELLLRVQNFISARLRSSQVELVLDVDEEILLETYPNELIQVFLNILNNAVDAYNERKSEKKKIVISGVSDGEIVRVSIHDDAGGIAEAVLHKLFEPYYSTKGKNGTGLGLYMSKMIIEKQFNGTISVRSEGESTTFDVRFKQKLN